MARRWVLAAAMAAAASILLYAATVNGGLEVLGTLRANVVDFTASSATAPLKTGTGLPASCSVGQAYFRTDAAAGQNLYLCTGANTWTQVQGGGGAGEFDWKPSRRYISRTTEFPYVYNAATGYFGEVIMTRQIGSQNLNAPTGFLNGWPNLDAVGISTTTTANNRSYWTASLATVSTTGSQSLYKRTDAPWELEVIFRYPETSHYANSNLLIGLCHAYPSNVPPRCVGLRYLAGTDTAFSYAQTWYNSWGTAVATPVIPDTAWHRLRVRSDGTVANKIWLRLDEQAEASVCPSGCDLAHSNFEEYNLTSFGVFLETTAAEQKVVQFDRMQFWADVGAGR